MNTTESAIKSRLFRARKVLAEKAETSPSGRHQADSPRNSLTEG
jgi:DNA-directed RNA polymerase specialized sigma24 family protein